MGRSGEKQARGVEGMLVLMSSFFITIGDHAELVSASSSVYLPDGTIPLLARKKTRCSSRPGRTDFLVLQIVCAGTSGSSRVPSSQSVKL